MLLYSNPRQAATKSHIARHFRLDTIPTCSVNSPDCSPAVRQHPTLAAYTGGTVSAGISNVVVAVVVGEVESMVDVIVLVAVVVAVEVVGVDIIVDVAVVEVVGVDVVVDVAVVTASSDCVS
jgi:hypothetical protein